MVGCKFRKYLLDFSDQNLQDLCLNRKRVSWLQREETSQGENVQKSLIQVDVDIFESTVSRCM